MKIHAMQSIQIELKSRIESSNFLFFYFSIKAVAGMASSQLSQINSVTAQSGGKDVDEFDILAQSRNDAKSYLFIHFYSICIHSNACQFISFSSLSLNF